VRQYTASPTPRAGPSALNSMAAYAPSPLLDVRGGHRSAAVPRSDGRARPHRGRTSGGWLACDVRARQRGGWSWTRRR
jgi:hypothetical protein